MTKKVELEDFQSEKVTKEGHTSDGNVNAFLNVPMHVQIVIGNTTMTIAQVLELSRGHVIELEKKIGEPVEVRVNNRLVAMGDLMRVGDGRIGVTLTEIVKEHTSGL